MSRARAVRSTARILAAVLAVLAACSRDQARPPAATRARVAQAKLAMPAPSVPDEVTAEPVKQWTPFSPSIASNGSDFLAVYQEVLDGWTLGDVYAVPLRGPQPIAPPAPFVPRVEGEIPVAPVVAFGAGRYAVAYLSRDPGGESIRTIGLGATGERLDLAPTVVARGSVYTFGIGCGDSGCLVVWSRFADVGLAVEAVRLDPLGNPLDATPIAVATVPSGAAFLAVATDPAGWLVGWTNGVTASATRVSADGAVLDSPPLALGAAGNGLLLDRAGDVTLAAWVDGSRLVGRRIGATGLLDPAPFPLSSFDVLRDRTGPSLAHDADGWVVLYERFTSNVRLYLARVGFDGTVPPPTPEDPLIETDAFQWDARIAGSGTSAVALWLDSRLERTAQLFAAEVVGGEGSPRDGVRISTHPVPLPDLQQRPAIACVPGGAAIAFEQRRASSWDVRFANQTPADERPGEQRSPAVASIPTQDGPATLLAFVSEDGVPHVHFQIFMPFGGVAVPPPSGMLASGVALESPSAAQLGPDAFLVAWEDRSSGTGDVVASRIALGQQSPGAPFPVAAGAWDESRPAVAWDGTGGLAAWSDARGGERGVYASRIAADGTPLDPGGLRVVDGPADRSPPRAAGSGRTWMIAWDEPGLDGREVHARRLDAAGDALDATDLVLAAGVGDRADPVVAWDGVAFVVVWRSGDPATGYDLRGVAVAEDGTFASSEYDVSTLAHDEREPAICSDGHGRVDVAYVRFMDPPYPGVDRVRSRTYWTWKAMTVSVATYGFPGRVVSDPPGIDCDPAGGALTCEAMFPSFAPVVLTAQPAPGSGLDGWSGACQGTGPCALPGVDDARYSVQAFFGPQRFPVTVQRTGAGSGWVYGSQLSCGESCTSDFYLHDQVWLNAVPDPGSTFLGWSGACEGLAPYCFVSDVLGATTIEARFEPGVRVQVDLLGTGGGRIVSDPPGIECSGTRCVGAFPEGSTVTFRGVPDASSYLEYFFCTGTLEPACTLQLWGEQILSASFAHGYPITIERAGAGTGRVTSAPAGIDCGASCSAVFNPNLDVELAATPDPGSYFAGWNGGPCTGSTASPCRIPGWFTAVIQARFEPTVQLTVQKLGAGSGRITSLPAGIDCGVTCSAGFGPWQSVELVAAAEPGSYFAGWVGGPCSGTGSCVVQPAYAPFVAATFEALLPVTVKKAGAGAGRVMSIPAGIDCGTTCAATFEAGRVVELVAAPDESSVFFGWTNGPCTGIGTCRVTSGATVTAVFEPKWPIQVSKAGTGTGRVASVPLGIDCGLTCTALFAPGETVQLVATADPDSVFAGWSGGPCAGTQSCFLSPGTSVSATFTKRFVVTVERSGEGEGAVASVGVPGMSCGTVCTAEFPIGSAVTLAANPVPGSFFAEWTGACSGSSPTCELRDPGGAATVVARFDLDRTPPQIACPAPIQVESWAGEPVQVAYPAPLVSDDHTPAAQITVWTSAAPGSSFAVGQTVVAAKATDLGGNSASCQFTVTVAPPPVLTLQVQRAGTGVGTVTSDVGGIACGTACTASLVRGTTVTLTATPGPESRFVGWSGACSGTGPCAVPLTVATGVTATFQLVDYALTVTRLGAGSGDVTSAPAGIACGQTCVAGFPSGTSVTLTAAPDASSKFSGWSGCPSPSGASCTVPMSSARAVSASFDPASFPLSVQVLGTGKGAVTGGGMSCGTGQTGTCTVPVPNTTPPKAVTLTATAAAGSKFVSWTGCTSVNKTACTVSVSSARTVSVTFDGRK